jgi:uncharacterized coiled-coil DUF342 family protein
MSVTMQEVYGAAKADNAEEAWRKLKAARPDFNPDVVNANGNTALITAAYKMHHRAVLFLLEHGADCMRRNSGGYTAMMYACYRGDKNSIRYLLASGADPKLKENTGRSSVDLCNNGPTRDFLLAEIDAAREKCNADAAFPESVQSPPPVQPVIPVPDPDLAPDPAPAPDAPPRISIEDKPENNNTENKLNDNLLNGNTPVAAADAVTANGAEQVAADPLDAQLAAIAADKANMDALLAVIEGLQRDLLAQRSEAASGRDRMAAELAVATKARDELLQEVQSLKAETFANGQLLSRCQEQQGELESLLGRADGLQEESRCLAEERDRGAETISALELTITEKTERVEGLMQDAGALTLAITGLEEKNSSLQDQADELNAKLNELSRANEDGEAANQQLAEDICNYEMQLSTMKKGDGSAAAAAALEAANAKLTNDIELLEAEREAGQSAGSGAGSSSLELSAAHARIEALELEQEQLKKTVNTHASASADNAKLKAQLADSDTLLQDLEEKIEELSGQSSFLKSDMHSAYLLAMDLLPAASYVSCRVEPLAGAPADSPDAVAPLVWEQVESSLLEESPSIHLSRLQTVLVITAVIAAMQKSKQNGGQVEIDQTDSSFFDQVSDNIVSLMGVDEEFILDDEGRAQIPVAFIVHVLHCAAVAFPVLVAAGPGVGSASSRSLLPAALPAGDHSTELLCGRPDKWMPCAKVSFSNTLPASVFNLVRVRLSSFHVPKTCYRNYSPFSMKCCDNHLESNVLLVLAEDLSSFRIWVAGTSHVLSSLVISTIMAVSAAVCPATEKVSVVVDPEYVEKYSKLSAKLSLQGKSVCPDLAAGTGSYSIPQLVSDEEGQQAFLVSAVQSVRFVLEAQRMAYKTLDESDFRFFDFCSFYLHFEFLASIPRILISTGFEESLVRGKSSKQYVPIQTLWFLCVKNSAPADVAGASLPDVWLFPASPGAFPSDAWALVKNAGFCVQDVYRSNNCDFNIKNVVKADGKLVTTSISNSVVVDALQCLGLSSVPGVTLLALLDPALFHGNARQSLFELLLARQRSHFEQVTDHNGLSHWVGSSVLRSRRPHARQGSVGGARTKPKMHLSSGGGGGDEELDLSALDGEMSLDDHAAVQKAAMVGEYSRRLTFHREKSSLSSNRSQSNGEGFNPNAEDDDMVFASQLKKEKSSAGALPSDAAASMQDLMSTSAVTSSFMLMTEEMWGYIDADKAASNGRYLRCSMIVST